MKLTRSLSALGLVAALASAPVAHAITFTLNTSSATVIGGNNNSAFYEATTSTDSGTAAAVFTFVYTAPGVSFPSNPPQIEIFFNGPQPVLSSAFWKAGNDHMLWDSTDLLGFNSGVYTSITLIGNGLTNSTPNGPTAYLGLSHAGLSGTVGTNPPSGPSVPDGGSTAVMLGLGLIAMAVALRRRS